VGNVPSDDERASECEARGDRVLGEGRQNVLHRLIQVHLDDLEVRRREAERQTETVSRFPKRKIEKKKDNE
jgi:hypothetical protein